MHFKCNDYKRIDICFMIIYLVYLVISSARLFQIQTDNRSMFTQFKSQIAK